jgi:hypothetical protein
LKIKLYVTFYAAARMDLFKLVDGPSVVIAVFLVVEIPLAVMSALHTISSR